MARTSQRLSVTAAKHKRVASDSHVGSKKAKISTSDDEGEQSSIVSTDASDFEITDASSADESVEEDEDDDDSEEISTKKSKKSTPRRATSTTNISKDVWREGVSAGLGPGKQVIIKRPKARSAGKIPYEDHTLHPNTFLFLEELKANNERAWLKMHDPDFRQAEKDWFSFVEKLTERLVDIDETVPELPVKDVIFRIYRDVRFSPDPTPYKAHFSVAFSRTGRKGPYAHYYVQIAGDESFIGGGLWHPEAASLARMRTAIDANSRRLKDVLLNTSIREDFLKGAGNNDAKVVKAFTTANAENALKTKPKGYDADHADIELLRLRNYTIGRKLSREELLGDGGLDRVAELLASMQPFITYLNSIVMPDEEEEAAEESDEEE